MTDFLTEIKVLTHLDRHSPVYVKTVLPRCLVRMIAFQSRLKYIGLSSLHGLRPPWNKHGSMMLQILRQITFVARLI